MTGKWEPEKYTDEYKSALLEMIQKKIELGDRAPAGVPGRLDQKVALVTGGASGIGRAAALALPGRGPRSCWNWEAPG